MLKVASLHQKAEYPLIDAIFMLLLAKEFYMKYIIFSLCLATGIFSNYLMPLAKTLPDESTVAYREALPVQCQRGDYVIILENDLREDFSCAQKDVWVKTLSYSIAGK